MELNLSQEIAACARSARHESFLEKTTDGEIHLNLIGRLITSPCMLRQHKNKLSIIKEKRQEEEKVELGR